MDVQDWSDARLEELFVQCDNTGRWGDDDQAGTLNHIDEQVRLAAAGEIRSGRVVALGRMLVAGAGVVARHPVTHHLLHSAPESAVDVMSFTPHDPLITHVDALGHIFWRGRAYNGRTRAEVLGREGLTFGDLNALAGGVFTRGVLLDVTPEGSEAYLESDAYVTIDDLEAAEVRQGVRVGRGDAVFVHTGRERRARADPAGYSPVVRAGLHASAMAWLHEREVAVYSGDCTERMPYPSAAVPFPVHQIGIVAMGLCLLDAPLLDVLVETCALEDRWTFALTFTPPDLVGATGFPVNPLCLF
jgi:kynurenine formamidase